MMHLKHGIFDEAPISLITTATVDEIGRLAVQHLDVRRFRPNLLIASLRSVPFGEDDWVGGVLSFGEDSGAAAIGITMRDERCSMVNYDPASARADAGALKAIVRERENKAGVYAIAIRCGRLAVGQPILLEPAAEHPRSVRRVQQGAQSVSALPPPTFLFPFGEQGTLRARGAPTRRCDTGQADPP